MSVTARQVHDVVRLEHRNVFGYIYATQNLTRADAVELADQLATLTGTKPDTIWVRADVLNDDEADAGHGRFQTMDTELPAWCSGDPEAGVSLYRFGFVATRGLFVCNARIIDTPEA